MVVFMNEIDMKERGIAPDDLVEIESLAGDGRRRVVRGFKVKPYAIQLPAALYCHPHRLVHGGGGSSTLGGLWRLANSRRNDEEI